MPVVPAKLRSVGAIVSTTGASLSMPVGANSPGDLAVVYVKGNAKAFTFNAGSPTINGFQDVYRYESSGGYEVVCWRKVPPQGLGANVTASAGAGQLYTGGWYGHVDVFSGVGFPLYGFADIPGTVGSYITYPRTALSSGTFSSLEMAVRVRLGTTGITQWVAGWGSSDAGLGMNPSGGLIGYMNNTSGAPIGNAASTVALPVSVRSQAVWLRVTINRATAQCAYTYSVDDVSEHDSVNVWNVLGTAVIGTNAGTTVRVSNSGTLLFGTNSTSTAAFNGDILAYHERQSGPLVDTASINFSEPQPTAVEVGTANIVRPITDDGSNSPIEDYGYQVTPMSPSIIIVPPRQVHTENSLIYHVFTLDRNLGTVAAITDSFGYTHHVDRFVSVPVGTARHQTYTKVATTVGETPTQNLSDVPSTTQVTYFALVIRGREAIVRPPLQPQSPHIQLGCADSYNLLITDNTYERTIEQVGWSKIKWERCLDDISKAQATIPDNLGGVYCLAEMGGLVPWRYGIIIERNDQEVWRGPVTNVSRRGTDIQIDAADIFCRYQKRFAARGVTTHYDNVDAGYLFFKVLTEHSYLHSDSWNLFVPDVHTGVSITRSLHPRELKYAWDLMSELLDSSIDAYMMNGTLYVWEPGAGWRYRRTNDVVTRTFEGPYNYAYDLVYGVFTEQAWSTRPDWSMDGAGQANYVAVPGIDSSEFGYRRISVIENAVSQERYGVLDYVDQDRIELPADTHPLIETDAMTRRANTLIALRAFSPATISGGALSEQAPIDMDNLRPGALWKLDIWDHGFGQLLTTGRLSRVTVDVSAGQSGIEEKVSPTLMPVGWEDG